MWLIDVAKQPDNRPLHILNAVLKRSKALSPYGEALRGGSNTASQLWFMRSTWRGRIVVYHGVRMQAAILHATAEMRAAPRPLPSSDWMKVISQWGVISHTSLWNRSLKLNGRIWKISNFNFVYITWCYILYSSLFPLNFPPDFSLFAFPSCTHWGCSL